MTPLPAAISSPLHLPAYPILSAGAGRPTNLRNHLGSRRPFREATFSCKGAEQRLEERALPPPAHQQLRRPSVRACCKCLWGFGFLHLRRGCRKKSHIYRHSLQEKRLNLGVLNPSLKKSNSFVVMHITQRREQSQASCTPTSPLAAPLHPNTTVPIDPTPTQKQAGRSGSYRGPESSAGTSPLPSHCPTFPYQKKNNVKEMQDPSAERTASALLATEKQG